MSQERETTHEAKTRDGRILTYAVSGDPSGWPVFLLHGTPGSRFGPKPRGSVLYRLGVRLICYDRPGYGGSTRQEGRTVADAVTDVRTIARDLNLGRFSVIGRSGGGPHALAAAALLPDVVFRTAVLVSIAPADAAGLDWYGGMVSDNAKSHSMSDVDTLTELIRLRADRAHHDPETLLSFLREQMTVADRRITNDVAIRRQLTATYAEALRQGPYGWLDDALAFRKEWGFRLADVASPVLLWHGAEDNFSPASHTRWLANRIPGATLRLQANSAHFGAVEILPEALTWVMPGQADRPGDNGAAHPGRGLEGVRVDDPMQVAALPDGPDRRVVHSDLQDQVI